jgi:hypothetical protein
MRIALIIVQMTDQTEGGTTTHIQYTTTHYVFYRTRDLTCLIAYHMTWQAIQQDKQYGYHGLVLILHHYINYRCPFQHHRLAHLYM